MLELLHAVCLLGTCLFRAMQVCLMATTLLCLCNLAE